MRISKSLHRRLFTTNHHSLQWWMLMRCRECSLIPDKFSVFLWLNPFVHKNTNCLESEISWKMLLKDIQLIDACDEFWFDVRGHIHTQNLILWRWKKKINPNIIFVFEDRMSFWTIEPCRLVEDTNKSTQEVFAGWIGRIAIDGLIIKWMNEQDETCN